MKIKSLEIKRLGQIVLRIIITSLKLNNTYKIVANSTHIIMVNHGFYPFRGSEFSAVSPPQFIVIIVFYSTDVYSTSLV